MIVPHPRCAFQGSLVALPTPFREGRVDLPALHALVDFHLDRGTDGLVVCGTTGEAPTLEDWERRAVLEATLARARGRLPVIAGVGTNDTRSTVAHARAAAELGADGLLVVTPYYNRPTQRGLEAHFGAVAEAVAQPIVLYNVPSRTGCDLLPATAAAIGERFPHVVAVKEALPSTERARAIVGETPCALLAGDDASIADFVSLGAVGAIDVVGNVVPEKIAELVRCSIPGQDARRAADLVEWLRPIVTDLYIETNPVPVKTAVALLIPALRDEVRLPLVPLEPANRARLETTLRTAGLL
ncbi:MAG: 4-hydroxy-tetrahydrodipicolinate synthase [Planctomycetes bacterium]|nr:4-hydroxy-tetrahydrodipicolinate synthase [Planctomycetota bacterium]